MSRTDRGLLAAVLVSSCVFAQSPNAPGGRASGSSVERDGSHDFDFEIGVWKTRLRRLVHPLTGSTTWVAYEGTTVVRKVWNGRANLVELRADGPEGHFEGLNLRLYDPGSHQWSLNFADARDGRMSPPTIGEFRSGRGEFYDQETFGGRTVLVRFVISDITSDSCRFEQAFSGDGGKGWEVNWIATDTRVKSESKNTGAYVDRQPRAGTLSRVEGRLSRREDRPLRGMDGAGRPVRSRLTRSDITRDSAHRGDRFSKALNRPTTGTRVSAAAPPASS
jgi:hypothetical protein